MQQTTEENDQLLLLELAWLGAMMQEVSGSTPKTVSQSAQKELSAEHLLIGGLTLSEAFNKQKETLFDRLQRAARMHELDGSAIDLKDTVQSAFKRAKQSAMATVATWIPTLSNRAVYQFGKNNPFVQAWRHVSVLDSRTSIVCTERSGLMWDKQHNPIGHGYEFAVPPLHAHCRSRLVWVNNPDAPFQGMTGEDWVKSRSLAQLQEQFGKGIGQMLHEGKISLSDAVKGGGLQALTLNELRQKHTAQIAKSDFHQRYLQLADEVARRKKAGATLAQVREVVPNDKVWQVATLNKQAVQWLEAKTNKVWISEDTVVKQIFNHPENHVWYKWFTKADELLNHAELVAYSKESRLKLIFMKSGDEILKTVVKVTGDREELYMVSIFKTSDKELRRVKSIHEVLFDKLKLDK